ncbi:MAG: hypothetical protein N2748_03795 [candidate division WOR-3 bacterium]|nr:hypothetical protein [candidate division WOR-3 bacterium]
MAGLSFCHCERRRRRLLRRFAPRNDISLFLSLRAEGEAISNPPVFASASEAISFFTSLGDCFVASLLAMT